jgi:hypothetical protein
MAFFGQFLLCLWMDILFYFGQHGHIYILDNQHVFFFITKQLIVYIYMGATREILMHVVRVLIDDMFHYLDGVTRRES